MKFMQSHCHLYVVRHGTSEWNKLGKIQGHTDISLASEGQEEAQQLAQGLKEISFSALVSSDLLRAKQTADILAKALEIENIRTTAKLRERHWGEWQGASFEELKQKHRDVIHQYIENFELLEPVHLPGIAIVETYVQAMNRVIPLLKETAQKNLGKNVLVVSHGGILRGLIKFLQSPHFESPSCINGGYLILQSDGEELSLLETRGIHECHHTNKMS